jgi:antirestriction protein ArdC
MPDFTPIPAIDRFTDALGARVIFEKSYTATYTTHTDQIKVSPLGFFHTAQYYTTLLHELAHWTGHPTRLGRTKGKTRDDPLFAREELTAIVANLHLCSFFGLAAYAIPNELAYAKTYLPRVAEDHHALGYALREGRRAALYLHQRQGRSLVRPDDVLSRPVDALAAACFSAMAPQTRPPATAHQPLLPLIEQFGIVPRARFA